MLLSSLIKDANDVCDRSPDQLACQLLQVIDSLNPNDRHRQNYLLSGATAGYPPQDQKRIEEAITEAWHWLTTEGHLVPRPDSRDSEFIQISRSGRRFMQDCQKSGELGVDPDDKVPLRSPELPPNPSEAMESPVDQSDFPSSQTGTDETSEAADGKKDSIDANSVSDEATTHDSLDFEPYVNALAEFLISPKTQPPLTLAIEGEWGSGKSSFMLQLQDRLKKRAPKHTIICFNPWRYEKQDELWAAFALRLTRTLRKRATVPDRFKGDIRLFFKRIKGFAGWTTFVTLVLLWVVALCAAIGVFHWALTKSPAQQQAVLTSLTKSEGTKADAEASPKPGKLAEQSPEGAKKSGETSSENKPVDGEKGKTNPFYQQLLAWGNRGGALAILIAIISSVWKSIRSRLLDVRLERFIDKPDYKGHASFVEDFHEDFAKAVESYTVSQDSKVFVFIDDLDRCEVPKAAELIQAINLLIGDGKQLIHILAIDRQTVAAGIAQKFKDMLEFLPEYEDKNGITVRSKLAFGYSFLEKFIQLSVRVPLQDDPDKIEKFLNELVSPTKVPAAKELTYLDRSIKRIQSLIAPAPEQAVETAAIRGNAQQEPATKQSSSPDDPDVSEFDFNRLEYNGESDRARGVVLMVRHVFRNNPRRLKIFLNTYRLSLYLASSQGLLDINRKSRQQVVTLEQLGKFVALTMRFPELVDVLGKNTKVLAEYEAAFLKSSSWPTEVPDWLNKDGIVDLFRYMGKDQQSPSLSIPEYSFVNFPVEKMLSATPVVPVLRSTATLPENLRPLAEKYRESLDTKTPQRNILLAEFASEAQRSNYIHQLLARAASGDELDILLALGVAAEPEVTRRSPESLFGQWYRFVLQNIKVVNSPHGGYVEYRAFRALREMEKAGRLADVREELLSVLEQNASRLENSTNRRAMLTELMALIRSNANSSGNGDSQKNVPA